ncbi:response regulator [Rhizobium ruizarguesonis]|uniref:response regulator n=1 Tax=Rhizobium ruizarguesonis TaxID=2081791 RepID=UPI00103276D7|nr:response regulator [Rhizobium ruizarguesonis]TBA84357.1 response regulator [Rhizobium ruizarguesonis]TBB10485.1 response regulator [Rhizobium ruizarguesonis]TBC28511.1 response regulator [Rhizobium ruizarguesonis]
MKYGKAVVLVVEDSMIIRMSAVDLVLSAGYETPEACDADEAIRILEARNDIDLVFTDVQMPGTMDGIKLSHYIRDRWPPVRLIIASGAAILEESDLPTGSRAFSKPYDNHAITDAMAHLLSIGNTTELVS